MALGVTAFNRDTIISVVIIMVINGKAEVESGIIICAEQIVGDNYVDCFEKNWQGQKQSRRNYL